MSKTSELQGAALDWAVAKCEGAETWNDCCQILLVGDDEPYHPSTNWEQGGPIIEREGISLEYACADYKWLWVAYKLGRPDEDNPQNDNSPLIAVMRCYVASKLGDEVEIPEGLK